MIVRRDRRKDLPVFASLLHVGNPGLLRGHLPTLGRHLLLQHGLLVTLVEVRLLGRQPAAVVPAAPRRAQDVPQRTRDAVPASAVDNLYSELALVAW